MGTSCPNCSVEVEVDFGMAQCSQCQAVFYVNLDGSTTVSTENSIDGKQSPENTGMQDPQTNSGENQWQDWGETASAPGNPMSQFVEPVPEVEVLSDSAWGSAQGVNESDFESPYDTALENSEIEAEQKEDNHDYHESEDLAYDVSSEPGEEVESGSAVEDETVNEQEPELEDNSWAESYENDEPKSSQEHLEDIVEFGNSEESQAREGIIFYRLLITGIDTSVERKELREILEDKKLMLSVEELLSEIDNGSLVISDLNPIKASIITSGIHNTKLSIDWSQYALNE